MLDEFARTLAGEIERLTLERVRAAVDGAASSGRRGGRRGQTPCYYPGCKNVAAPRFGMFCAALHKNLPAADKKKYREKHVAKNGS
jgi:hypothetical protein